MRIKRWMPVIVGVSVAPWRGEVGAERAREAPVCAPGQVFSGTGCRATVAGELTRFTGSEMDVAVDGRSINVGVTTSGPRPSTSPAVPVEVTIHKGQIIHVASATNLNVGTDAAPSTRSGNYRNFGFCFLVFGAALGIYSALKTAKDREEPDQDPPWPGQVVG